MLKARLACRAKPTRARDDKTKDGCGVHSKERIMKYDQDGYNPFWMQKGAVDSWVPKDRSDTPSRKLVKDTPETEWFMWIAGIIDEIEDVGRTISLTASVWRLLAIRARQGLRSLKRMVRWSQACSPRARRDAQTSPDH